MTSVTAVSGLVGADLVIDGETVAGADGTYSIHNPARPAEIVGKALSEADFELATAPVIAHLLAGMAETVLAPEYVDPGSDYPRLQREPFGVAALILPFNWPVAVSMTKLGPALAAGNTTVVKVPPTCPLTVLKVLAEFAAALPAGVVNVLSGPGPELGRALVAHPGINV